MDLQKISRTALKSACFFLLALFSFGSATGFSSQSFLVIVSGLAGEPRYREAFHEWAVSMYDSAINIHGLSENNVYYLAADPEIAPELIHAQSSKENIESLFVGLKESILPKDQVFILLIGHGTYRSDRSRFNLPGPDLSAQDFAALLEVFDQQQIVFVNSSSASGGFIPVLAGNNRIVITATKSGYERNESVFGKYFVEAYASSETDTDKDSKVSVLEAFNYARFHVSSYYNAENILQTEHAVFDDDGDGIAVQEPTPGIGELAASTYLFTDVRVFDSVSAADRLQDPRFLHLVSRKLELEESVKLWVSKKESVPEDIYFAELERILVELAEVVDELGQYRSP